MDEQILSVVNQAQREDGRIIDCIERVIQNEDFPIRIYFRLDHWDLISEGSDHVVEGREGRQGMRGVKEQQTN